MTVCVAALCEGNAIIGASDRMLTSGDIQFEPQQTKIVSITNSIAVMVAGDSAMQTEIVQQVIEDVQGRIEKNSTEWLKVKDIAELYSKFYNRARSMRAEIEILAPLGLTHDTFISRQNELAPELANKIATELINYAAPDVQAIIAGVDTTGGHVYLMSGAHISCQDAVGFAAIGVGYWHADSQFMFAGHNRRMTFPETLLLAYSAKRRAEVAPGVGSATDMFYIGTLGGYYSIGDHVITKLAEIYEKVQNKAVRADVEAKEEVKTYVEEITKRATSQQQEASPQDDR